MKKRLDILSFCTYTGASNTKYNHRRTTTGAPAPKILKSQAISQNNWWRVSRETIAEHVAYSEAPKNQIGRDRIYKIANRGEL